MVENPLSRMGWIGITIVATAVLGELGADLYHSTMNMVFENDPLVIAVLVIIGIIVGVQIK